MLILALITSTKHKSVLQPIDLHMVSISNSNQPIAPHSYVIFPFQVETSDEDSVNDAVQELATFAQSPTQVGSSTAGTSTSSSSSEQSTNPARDSTSPSFRPPPGAFRLPGLPAMPSKASNSE